MVPEIFEAWKHWAVVMYTECLVKTWVKTVFIDNPALGIVVASKLTTDKGWAATEMYEEE